MNESELLDRNVLARLPTESETEWYARAGREVAASRAGPLTLWAERRHPLVRAEARRRGRQLRRGIIGITVTPYAILGGGCGLVVLLGGPKEFATAAVFFSAIMATMWVPVAILAGAAMAVESVVDERRSDTAIQLALTPLPPRTLAAAKVLPHFRVSLWALVALLPMYLMSSCWLADPAGMPNCGVLMPLRLGAMVSSTMKPAAPAIATAVVMFIGDAILAWASVHWAAAWAVRYRGSAWAGGIILARLLGVLLCIGLVEAACLAQTFWLRAVGANAGGLTVSVVLLLVVVLKGGHWLAARSVRAALREFANFHRLAADPDGVG